MSNRPLFGESDLEGIIDFTEIIILKLLESSLQK
jgi:hypothetical protein